jgi:hypothetical protein
MLFFSPFLQYLALDSGPLAGGMAQVVESLPNKYQALSSNTGTTTTKIEKKKKKFKTQSLMYIRQALNH